jgi:hypothetical protein
VILAESSVVCDDIQRANTDFVNRTIRQLATYTVQICYTTAAIMEIEYRGAQATTKFKAPEVWHEGSSTPTIDK